jgi:hypothetical protein
MGRGGGEYIAQLKCTYYTTLMGVHKTFDTVEKKSYILLCTHTHMLKCMHVLVHVYPY